MNDPPAGQHSIHIGTMTNSAIQANSPGASQIVAINQSQRTDIRALVTDLRSALDKLGLSEDQRADVQSDVETLEAQLKKSSPSPSVIRGCLENAKGVLQKVAVEAASGAAAALATGLLEKITHWMCGST